MRRMVGKLINLSTKFSDLRCELFALLRVLPLCRLFTLDNLQQMNMLLFELLLLQQQLVKTFSISCATRCDEMGEQQRECDVKSGKKQKSK
jgi:hypothetical protein